MADLITLVLPHAADVEIGRLPALETLLARSDSSAGIALPTPDRHNDAVPFAAYGCLGEGGTPNDAYWLCAEPAHLLADQDQVYLAAYGPTLNIGDEEAAILTAEFNALFGSDDWQLQALTPERWYLRTPQRSSISTTHPEQALGCAIRPLLPRGDDAMQWHAFLTEVEMLFHASEVNARRREQGMPVISGLWLWGGGQLPEQTALLWDTLHGNTPWLHGMAQHGGKQWRELAADATNIIEAPGTHLLMFEAESHALAVLEQQWFAPLLQAVKTGQVRELELQLSASATRHHIGRAQLRRWWRRRKSWSQHASPAA